MRNIILLLGFMIYYSALKGQCPSFPIFENQSEIDSFLIKYPLCKKIDNVTILNEVYDISGLINQVDTILSISVINSKVKNISLSNIFFKNIGIGNNDSLQYISLKAEFDVGRIEIGSNNNLKKITSDLKFVNDYIILCSGDEIEMNFENKSENLIINNFSSFCDVKFSNNQFKVKEECHLYNNSSIKSFKEISPYIHLDTLVLLDIHDYDTFDFETIEQVSKIKEIRFGNIKELNLNAFTSANIQISQLTIGPCPNLKSLMPFKNCEINSIHIYDNDSLTSLDGIVFKGKKAQIRLQLNDQLQDIDIVENIDTFVGKHPTFSIQITGNPLLETCRYDIICKTLLNPRDSMRIAINGNLNECETKETIIEACLVNTDELEDYHVYNIYQNEFFIAGFENVRYYIFDLQGKIIEEGKYVNSIKLDNFPCGIYLIMFRDTRKENIFKVIKF